MYADVRNQDIATVANSRQGWVVELGFWLYMFYTNILVMYDIEVNMLGILLMFSVAGLILLLIYPPQIFQSTTLVLVILLSGHFFFVLAVVHGQIAPSPFVEKFVQLIFSIIIYSFLLKRPGFARRIILAMFIIGFLAGTTAGERLVGRLQTNVPHLSNANDYGYWMGFCALALGMWGVTAKKIGVRIGLWIMMFLSIYMVGQTVSRGTLVAMVVAMVFFLVFYAPRKVPVEQLVGAIFVLFIGALIFTQTSAFAEMQANYSNRWDADTGREALWPQALRNIRGAPLLGGGVQAMRVVTPTKIHTAHNPFLVFGLLGGVFSAVLFAAQYVLAFVKMEKTGLIDEVFWLPALFLYMIISIQTANFLFITHWAMLTIVMCLELSYQEKTDKAPVPVSRRIVLHQPGVLSKG